MIHITSVTTKSTITNVTAVDVQPNAVDVRLNRVFRITDSPFVISEDRKKHRFVEEVKADEGGVFHLPVGEYEVVMENEVEVAEGEAGWLVARSTLNRNGVFITSGIYDSGYKGVLAGVLHVRSGSIEVTRGTRIAQFILMKAEMKMAYNGSYGAGSAHDEKYV